MKVSMYKAADGTLFDKQKDMLAHNVKLRLKPAAQNFVASLPDNAFTDTDAGATVVFKSDLADLIVDHADLLRSVLNDALIIRKPRKKKAAAPTGLVAPAQDGGPAALAGLAP